MRSIPATSSGWSRARKWANPSQESCRLNTQRSWLPPAPAAAPHFLLPQCGCFQRKKGGGIEAFVPVSAPTKLPEDFDLPPQGPSKRSPAAARRGRSL